MERNDDFRPAEGVTLENSISYIAAVEEAVRNEYGSIEPELRTAVLTAVRTALCFVVDTIDEIIDMGEMRVAASVKPVN